MKTIASTETIKLSVNPNELINGKWLNFQLLSKKLGEIENQKKMAYKSLRNKFYNSRACGKYNMQEVAGLPCINIEEPMKGKASLELVFEKKD
jgi:hypothetical protein